MTTRRQFIGGSVLGLISASSMLSFPMPSIAAGAKDKIRLNRISNGLMSFPELADALGYFDGIELEVIGNAVGGPTSIQNVATNQVDFGYPFNATLIAARAAGVKVKAVCASAGANALSPNGFYVLEDSPIQNPRDLIGKKVGMNTFGAAFEAFLDEYLLKGGLTPDELKQVTRVTIPASSYEQALRLKQVDLVPLNAALLHNALTVGGGGIRVLFSAFSILGDVSFSTYVMRDSTLVEQPDLVRRFVAATAEAILFTQTHDPAEAVEIYSKYLVDHDRAEESKAMAGWVPTIGHAGGVLAPEEFTTWIRWLEATGEIAPGSVEVQDLFSNEFNPYAGKLLPASEASKL